MLNDKLNIQELSQEFNKKENCGIIAVRNFLDSEFAGLIAEQISKIHKTEWKYKLRDFTNLESHKEKLKPKPKHDAEDLFKAKYNLKINNFLLKMHELNNEERNAYFYEINDNNFSEKRTGRDILVEFKNFLAGKDNLAFLSQVSGFKIKSLKDSFITKYSAGYFRGTNSDPYSLPKYKLQIILNLSPYWRFDYGGVLNFMSKDKTQLVQTPLFDFNTLIIAKTLVKGSIPYNVTSIPPKINKHKYFYNCYFG
tara:strand:- start:14386 stop:15144 length:759 start_codon:yes stop_codon:yes gene_type:complete